MTSTDVKSTEEVCTKARPGSKVLPTKTLFCFHKIQISWRNKNQTWSLPISEQETARHYENPAISKERKH